MRAFANFISYLFHPIFLYTYLYIAYWWIYPYPATQLPSSGILLLCGLLFFNTAIVPVSLLMARKVNLVDQSLPQRQRTIVVVLVIYLATYFMFPSEFIPKYLLQVLLSIIVGLVVAFAINYTFKISLHGSAWGGFTSVALYLLVEHGGPFYWFFMASVICSGLVGFSRLYLGQHTSKELYLGYLCGLFITSEVMFLH